MPLDRYTHIFTCTCIHTQFKIIKANRDSGSLEFWFPHNCILYIEQPFPGLLSPFLAPTFTFSCFCSTRHFYFVFHVMTAFICVTYRNCVWEKTQGISGPGLTQVFISCEISFPSCVLLSDCWTLGLIPQLSSHEQRCSKHCCVSVSVWQRVLWVHQVVSFYKTYILASVCKLPFSHINFPICCYFFLNDTYSDWGDMKKKRVGRVRKGGVSEETWGMVYIVHNSQRTSENISKNGIS